MTITSTPTALPTSLRRPTDLPTDGTCEEGHTCLGLLDAGTHHSKVFTPGFAFSTAGPGWENYVDEGGTFTLLSTEHPGDEILIARRPQATKPDGSIDAITEWLTKNPAVTTSAVAEITVGPLHGVRLDIATAPGQGVHPTNCEVPTCVLLFRGRDPSSKPTWQWDYGVATGERERLYLLQVGDEIVAIFADSVDGTTFDALAPTTDAIVDSVRFDGS